MDSGQNLVNAQVLVNRAVWAANTEYNDKEAFISKKERDQYIAVQAKQAIEELNKVVVGYGFPLLAAAGVAA